MTRHVARMPTDESRRELAELMADDRLVPLLSGLRAHHWESYAHCLRVGLVCLQVAHERRDGRAEREQLGRAGLLHDIGKLAVSKDVLAKPGRLTDAQRADVRTHALAGFEALEVLDHEPARLAVLAHHRFGFDPYPEHPAFDADGAGWTETDRELALEMAEIVAVADIVDALSSRRAYRAGLEAEQLQAVLDQEFTGDRRHVALVLGRG